MRWVVIGAIAVALAGCSGPTQPNIEAASRGASLRSMPEPEHERRPVQLKTSVRVEPRRIASGEIAHVTVSVKNMSRESVTLYFGTTCQLMFRIEDFEGRRLGPGWWCGYFPTQLRLGPGEEKRTVHEWGVSLPPGFYRAYADVGQLPAGRPFVFRVIAPRVNGIALER